MPWDTSLETGLAVIDEQHKELFRRVDDLIAAGRQRQGKNKIKEMLEFLGEYVVLHFRDEQNYQMRMQYPKAPAHKAMHDAYIQSFQALCKSYAEEGDSLNIMIKVNRSVVDWLVQHISVHDRDFARYVKSKEM